MVMQSVTFSQNGPTHEGKIVYDYPQWWIVFTFYCSH
jgi:hypothetical protein